MKLGGSSKNLKAPQLSSGSLIDCIRALYDKACSLKGAGFNRSPELIVDLCLVLKLPQNGQIRVQFRDLHKAE